MKNEKHVEDIPLLGTIIYNSHTLTPFLTDARAEHYEYDAAGCVLTITMGCPSSNPASRINFERPMHGKTRYRASVLSPMRMPT